ncbi:EAL domain-containing protein [Alginatibacterium sediminis]|uniref:cyclic-guanylate-specific phosphodiesterase n=1 Tax=Alginatibacterium sediminis TaxID=2164068 RepID=A0A420ED82_9ALTE|nr:EAL domain-containing protein [Alginatibacterium sediminis]RKF18630.1 EAL domain-containing protein [Alginatibacterium sediminis]
MHELLSSQRKSERVDSSQFSTLETEAAIALATVTGRAFFESGLSLLSDSFKFSHASLVRVGEHGPGEHFHIATWDDGTGQIDHCYSPIDLLKQLQTQGQHTYQNLPSLTPDGAHQQSFYAWRLDPLSSKLNAFICFSFKHSQVDYQALSNILELFRVRFGNELLSIRNEEHVRWSEATFESNLGMVISDPSLVIRRVNRAFLNHSGYRLDELIGRRLNDIFEEPEGYFYAAQHQSSALHQQKQRQRKNGELYTQLETISVLRNKNDEVSEYLVNCQDISARLIRDKQIENLAFFDELTGLPNRRKLQEELITGFTRARNEKFIGALLFVDLDHFKNINDSLGHAAGDWVLREVAKRLKLLSRQGDVLARLGGDEFVIMLANLGDSPPHAELQAGAVSKRLIEKLSAPYPFEGQSLHIGASVGVSLFPGKGQTAEDLLKQADTAMYQAKSAGRRTVIFFDERMQRQADKRLKMNNDLRNALNNQELMLYFQPQHLVSKGSLIGAEALVRWKPEGKNIVSPDQFIPMAEESDLIIDIGMWVLDQSFMYMAKWQEMGLTLPELSVNVSAKQFHHPDFVEQVEEIMNRYSLETARFNLEITESVVLGHAEETVRKMEQLKEAGLRFTIDDFGAGYSSLSYLKKLPVDELKIDRSFICNIPRDTRDMAIVEAVLAIARHLGYTVTAEGVETPQQLEFLRKQECSFYQGYLASKPLPADAMARYIAKYQKQNRLSF